VFNTLIAVAVLGVVGTLALAARSRRGKSDL
jgi:hypothetical protein